MHRYLIVVSLAFAACHAQDASDLVKPEVLAKQLSGGARPVVFYVGPPVIYRAAHIPGAKLAGPGMKPEGLEALKAEVSGLKRDVEIVLYCGCCPWEQCPNVRPAFKLLRDLGFRRAKVLYLPTNLRTDWIAKGYPVDRPQGPDSRIR